ncbi:E3 ubiquitin-protein ligase CBL-C [Apodemus speciosus]|uniref:E3 ubiquitin-protein ligase CBL-C n=1 Tax=Apodemus speciosus TaxID=105296 RepID=A0ABQ0EX98_APOSI
MASVLWEVTSRPQDREEATDRAPEKEAPLPPALQDPQVRPRPRGQKWTSSRQVCRPFLLSYSDG